jgi:outer membrane lipoprotein-sorting protein
MAKKLLPLLLLILAGILCWAQEEEPSAQPPPDPKLEALVKKMDEVQKNLKTLRVTFTQTNQFRMLSKPQVFKGVLTLKKPDTALYRYTSPSSLYFLVKDGDLLVYNPAEKKVVVQDIRRHQNRIIRYLGVGQPMEELRSNFQVTWVGEEGDVAQLCLVPKKLRLRRKFSMLTFWVDAQTGYLKAFELVESEGDRIRFDFSHWEENPALTDDAFKVEIPPGVKVHRQLMDLAEPFQR